jgi:hypothetical protein
MTPSWYICERAFLTTLHAKWKLLIGRGVARQTQGPISLSQKGGYLVSKVVVDAGMYPLSSSTCQIANYTGEDFLGARSEVKVLMNLTW